MADENKEAPVPEEMFHEFQCKVCGKPVRAKYPPPENFVFSQSPKLSMIGLPHEEPTICPNCGLHYQMVIAGIQPNILWMPMEDKREKSRIVLPNMPLPFMKRPKA